MRDRARTDAKIFQIVIRLLAMKELLHDSTFHPERFASTFMHHMPAHLRSQLEAFSQSFAALILPESASSLAAVEQGLTAHQLRIKGLEQQINAMKDAVLAGNSIDEVSDEQAIYIHHLEKLGAYTTQLQMSGFAPVYKSERALKENQQALNKQWYEVFESAVAAYNELIEVAPQFKSVALLQLANQYDDTAAQSLALMLALHADKRYQQWVNAILELSKVGTAYHPHLDKTIKMRRFLSDNPAVLKFLEKKLDGQIEQLGQLYRHAMAETQQTALKNDLAKLNTMRADQQTESLAILLNHAKGYDYTALMLLADHFSAAKGLEVNHSAALLLYQAAYVFANKAEQKEAALQGMSKQLQFNQAPLPVLKNAIEQEIHAFAQTFASFARALQEYAGDNLAPILNRVSELYAIKMRAEPHYPNLLQWLHDYEACLLLSLDLVTEKIRFYEVAKETQPALVQQLAIYKNRANQILILHSANKTNLPTIPIMQTIEACYSALREYQINNQQKLSRRDAFAQLMSISKQYFALYEESGWQNFSALAGFKRYLELAVNHEQAYMQIPAQNADCQALSVMTQQNLQDAMAEIERFKQRAAGTLPNKQYDKSGRFIKEKQPQPDKEGTVVKALADLEMQLGRANDAVTRPTL